MTRTMIIAVLAIAAAGCATMQLSPEYQVVKAENYVVGEKTFHIFQHPKDADRLWVQDYYGAAVGKGFMKGLTFGLMNVNGAASKYEEAAVKYLASKGRSCEVVRSSLVDDVSYEVRVKCQPAPSTTS